MSNAPSTSATQQTADGAILLKTAIPGPNSQAIVARREAASPPGASKLTPLAVDHAHGALVTDVDGNVFIDLAGGIGMLAVGHTPDSVVSAITSQASKVINQCAIVATAEVAVDLCERLNELFPGDGPAKTVLMNSGAEAVETAVNIARAATGRQGIVVFEGGYHGRTNLTLSMTSKFGLFKKGFGPFAPEVYRFPYPNLYRKPVEMTDDQYIDYCISVLDHDFVAIVDPGHVAAVVIEPVQGEAGFVTAPARWMQHLAKLCAQHGIVFISDEIQAGMGRTGKLWAIEHAGVQPDIITTAKSLGAGMPISAIVGRADLMDAPHPGGLGGTYSGNPLACAAALAAVDEIATPAFLTRAEAVGKRMRTHLDAIQAAHPNLVGDVRGVGPMLVMEIVSDPVAKTPDMESTAAICTAALQRGVICIRAGLYSNCVRFLPPLIITDQQIDEAMAQVAAAVAEVAP